MQLAHLIYSEGFSVAELAELSLGAQQFSLYFWSHVGQQGTQIGVRGHGEVWQ